MFTSTVCLPCASTSQSAAELLHHLAARDVEGMVQKELSALLHHYGGNDQLLQGLISLLSGLWLWGDAAHLR